MNLIVKERIKWWIDSKKRYNPRIIDGYDITLRGPCPHCRRKYESRQAHSCSAYPGFRQLPKEVWYGKKVCPYYKKRNIEDEKIVKDIYGNIFSENDIVAVVNRLSFFKFSIQLGHIKDIGCNCLFINLDDGRYFCSKKDKNSVVYNVLKMKKISVQRENCRKRDVLGQIIHIGDRLVFQKCFLFGKTIKGFVDGGTVLYVNSFFVISKRDRHPSIQWKFLNKAVKISS